MPDSPTQSSGTLQVGELHPATEDARNWLMKQDKKLLVTAAAAFSSCAIDGNRLAEVCSETLRRILANEPVSDRYLLGLVWVLRNSKEFQP